MDHDNIAKLASLTRKATQSSIRLALKPMKDQARKIRRSDSLYIGQRTPVLSETDTLKLGLNYFLLPSDFFMNSLSFLTIAALKSFQNGVMLVRKSAGTQQQQPFLIQKGGTGDNLRISVSEEFMSELMIEGRKNREQGVEEEGEGKN
ncbi:hypothetical protein HID58_002693 [Brassica napus]|uniref:Uncharacterized protein n=2 Tax=Brassica napus TaxID=3708 RepID=A0ABQ8ER28_BRANA|nr:hypothetical protein HID58_002693 [Brassica napus]CDY47172.1 BnaA01g22980D [Brassica napus]